MSVDGIEDDALVAESAAAPWASLEVEVGDAGGGEVRSGDAEARSLGWKVFDRKGGMQAICRRTVGARVAFRLSVLALSVGCAPSQIPTIWAEAGSDLGEDAVDAGLDGAEASVVIDAEPAPPEDVGEADAGTFGLGCLSAEPNRLTFSAAVDAPSSLRLSMRNACVESAFVTSYRVQSGTGPFTVEPAPLPIEIGPMSSFELVVTYAPGMAGDDDFDRLLIDTNDVEHPTIGVELYGYVLVPRFEPVVRAVDLGTVVFREPVGADGRSACRSRESSVRFYNSGDADLIVSRVDVEGGSDGVFEVMRVVPLGQASAEPLLPIIVRPGRSVDLVLRFWPTRTSPADHAAVLALEHNATPEPERISLHGVASSDGPVEDVFVRPEMPKLDVLFVVDDSCSMFDEQERLSLLVRELLSALDTLGVDYQMGVTVTDVSTSTAGALRRCPPHPAVVRFDDLDRADALECMVLAGTSGSGREQAFHAARLALDRASDPTDPNAELVRSDATLAIVTVSDEEEQSSEPDLFFRDFFEAQKTIRSVTPVTVHAIAGPVRAINACPKLGGAQPGFRYEFMTQATGGTFFDICESDWRPFAQPLAAAMVWVSAAWPLRGAADPATLIVEVDAVAVPNDAASGYSYDPLENVVRIPESVTSTHGSTIEVVYTPLCQP